MALDLPRQSIDVPPRPERHDTESLREALDQRKGRGSYRARRAQDAKLTPSHCCTC